jgi:hypothetical protein
VSARHLRAPSGLLLLGAAAGCILHTETINSAPEVVKISGPTEILKGIPAMFQAEVRDPDQPPQTLNVEWRVRPGMQSCPVTLDDAVNGGRPVVRGTEADPLRVSVDINDLEPFCVWAVVTDRERAQAFGGLPAKPTNQQPRAAIDVVKGKGVPTTAGLYELYSAFQLTGTGSMDPEGVDLAFRWEMIDPTGKRSTPPACPAPNEKDICFNADAPGAYVVTLRVFYEPASSSDPAAEAMRTLMVDQDRPPCIRFDTASPRLGLPQIPSDYRLPVSFEVTVDDDGDPYPEVDGRLSMHEFVWFVRPPTATQFVRLGSGSSPQLNIHVVKANSYGLGDTVQVRVLYRDRVMRDFRDCEMKNPDACALRDTTPRCYQWVTWTIQY